MRKKAIVTGASGYIGSRLTHALVAEGWEVYVILRPNSSISLLEDITKHISIFRFDGEFDNLRKFFQQIQPIEIVFHLAAYFVADHKWQQVEILLDSNIRNYVNRSHERNKLPSFD